MSHHFEYPDIKISKKCSRKQSFLYEDRNTKYRKMNTTLRGKKNTFLWAFCTLFEEENNCEGEMERREKKTCLQVHGSYILYLLRRSIFSSFNWGNYWVERSTSLSRRIPHWLFWILVALLSRYLIFTLRRASDNFDLTRRVNYIHPSSCDIYDVAKNHEGVLQETPRDHTRTYLS